MCPRIAWYRTGLLSINKLRTKFGNVPFNEVKVKTLNTLTHEYVNVMKIKTVLEEQNLQVQISLVSCHF